MASEALAVSKQTEAADSKLAFTATVCGDTAAVETGSESTLRLYCVLLRTYVNVQSENARESLNVCECVQVRKCLCVYSQKPSLPRVLIQRRLPLPNPRFEARKQRARTVPCLLRVRPLLIATRGFVATRALPLYSYTIPLPF